MSQNLSGLAAEGVSRFPTVPVALRQSETAGAAITSVWEGVKMDNYATTKVLQIGENWEMDRAFDRMTASALSTPLLSRAIRIRREGMMTMWDRSLGRHTYRKAQK